VNAPNWVYTLPSINAALNTLATILLVSGYLLIQRGQKVAHKRVMLSAFATSVLFLVFYLTYHFALKHYTGVSSKPFQGQGLIRPIYFTILITHVILAAIVPFLAMLTIYRGLKGQWRKHRRIAKITFPIWLFVSLTGVIIYGMLYRWPV
jgi:protein SCO1